MNVNGKLISNNSEVYLIAEIGINHNGNMSIAKQLIDAAADAGFDAVKFQKRTIELVYTKEFLDSPRESPWGNTQRAQKEGLEFSLEQYQEIDQYCERKVYPETKESLISFCNNGHRATDLIIEDANTGSSLIQELPNDERLYGVSIIPISHGGIKKEIRFSTATGAMSSGTYFFPKDATWYPSFESELMQFPKGRHDDRCDCLSQFAHWEVKQSLMFNFWCESI